MKVPRNITSLVFCMMLFVLPASTTYEMHDVGFGSGGSGLSESANYAMTGEAGDITGSSVESTTYDLGPGLQFTRQANVPNAPSLTNPNSYYNKLLLVLDNQQNPDDALFAVAISSDAFVTTGFVQQDFTIGALPVYQTYAAWGGSTGNTIVGLEQNTTYQVKVKATQTKYDESGYSVVASASTVSPMLSLDLDISSTDTESSPPYILAFSDVSMTGVTTLSSKIWIDLNTNAQHGAYVYIRGQHAGLTSARASHTIPSITGDISSVSEGFGVRADTLWQSAGGPLVAVAPFNGSGELVGSIGTTNTNIFSTSNQPMTNGRASILVKAKASIETPAASDYETLITVTASGTF